MKDCIGKQFGTREKPKSEKSAKKKNPKIQNMNYIFVRRIR
jgi:hypothetical protein